MSFIVTSKPGRFDEDTVGALMSFDLLYMARMTNEGAGPGRSLQGVVTPNLQPDLFGEARELLWLPIDHRVAVAGEVR